MISIIKHFRPFRLASVLYAFLVAGLAISQSASAWEFRKCSMDIVISGAGVPATTVPGSQVVGWARTNSGSRSAQLINALANQCLGYAIRANRSELPEACETDNRILGNENKRGRGLTGFSLTNGLDALKNTICDSSYGRNYSRSEADKLYDKRRIEGFRVSFRKTGGRAACRGEQFFPTQMVEVMCKAHREMLRFERPIAKMYREASGWPVPNMCRTPVSAQAGGDSIPAAEANAVRAWQTQVVRQFGSGMEDHRKRKGTDMKCAKRLSGEPKVICTSTATPCYF